MSMTREAFEAVREAIVSGTLEFGAQLSEVQIADALGMSRAPVRAAFIQLREMGLVKIVPQAGTYVFHPSAEDVRNMSEFRSLLETEALRKAMAKDRGRVLSGLDGTIDDMTRAIAAQRWDGYRRADSAFHMVIMNGSGNRYLLKAYGLTSSALEALRVWLQGGTGGYREQSFHEHTAIRDLLQDGSIEEACDLLSHHILVINETLPPMTGAPSNGRGDRDYAAALRR
ncbi:MAG: GntR family transcriptional regulator [Bauldia sp.]|nr:GntR family transcriptional regulator [Bauldia sp.]